MSAPLLLPGKGVADRSAIGQASVSSGRSAQWAPPWHTTLAWSANAPNPTTGRPGAWVASINPGTVSGKSPVWEDTPANQKALGMALLANTNAPAINPFTGKPWAPVVEGDPTQAQFPLYAGPKMAIPWRAIGYDGDGTTGVPDYFVALGAQNNAALQAIAAGNTNAIETAGPDSFTQSLLAPPPTLRLLRQCDFWIKQPQAAVAVNESFPGIDNLQPGVAQQRLTLQPADPKMALQILCGDANTALSNPNDDPLSGQFFAPDWDVQLICTVYALSAPGAELGSAPDGSWTPYVKHAIWWPLTYVPAVFAPLLANTGTGLIAPIVGIGAAQTIINAEVGQINDATNTAANEVASNGQQGQFYNVTGGGSFSLFPPAPAAAPTGKTGFDIAGINQATAAAARAAAAALTLDPPFPYTPLPFSATLLKTGAPTPST